MVKIKETTTYYPKVSNEGFKIQKSYTEEWSREELEHKDEKDFLCTCVLAATSIIIVWLIARIFY